MYIMCVIIIFVASSLLSYHIIKMELSLKSKLLRNTVSLLVSFFLLLISDVNETALTTYLLLLLLTFVGVVSRLLTPVILNSIGIIFSKLTKKEHESQSYEQLLHDGHRMYFCVLLFTTFKISLYVLFYICVICLVFK